MLSNCYHLSVITLAFFTCNFFHHIFGIIPCKIRIIRYNSILCIFYQGILYQTMIYFMNIVQCPLAALFLGKDKPVLNICKYSCQIQYNIHWIICDFLFCFSNIIPNRVNVILYRYVSKNIFDRSTI